MNVRLNYFSVRGLRFLGEKKKLLGNNLSKKIWDGGQSTSGRIETAA